MRLLLRTQVLIWLCALTVVAYVQRTLGVAETTVQKELGFTLEEMALIQSSFFWSYALFQVPGGWLAYRWGPRVGLTAFCLAGSLAIGLTSLTDRAEAWYLARLLLGLGQAAALPCLAKVIAVWYPPSRRAIATGAIAASMQIGAMINAFATGPLLKRFTLVEYFWILAIPGVLWSLGFYAWFRNTPGEFRSLSVNEWNELPRQTTATPASQNRWWPFILTLVTCPVLWFICIQQCCRAAGYVFFSTWFPRFLQETRHLDVTKSGNATAYMFCGVLVGSLFGGALSDWILARTGSAKWSRKGVAIVSLGLCGLSIIMSYFVQRVEVGIALMTFGAFCSGVGGPSSYTVTIDISGRHITTIFGVMNTIGNLGAAAFAHYAPKLLQGSTGQKWDLVIFVFASLYFGATACWFLINPAARIFPEESDG